jgi:hypothetical protein
MRRYLYAANVLLKGFKAYVQQATEEIRQATARTAEAAGPPVIYLASSALRMDDVAREIAQRDGTQEGLICVLPSKKPGGNVAASAGSLGSLQNTWQSFNSSLRRSFGVGHLRKALPGHVSSPSARFAATGGVRYIFW